MYFECDRLSQKVHQGYFHLQMVEYLLDFGFVLDEIVRRLAGMPLGQYFDENFAVPMGLEFWIGLPQKYYYRVATLYP